MTSVLNVDTIADKAGTGPATLTKQSATKVWHNQTADGQTVNGSFNLSSLSDLASGNYQVNVTNNLSDANYSGSMTMITNNKEEPFLYLLTTSSYRNYVYDGSYSDGANATAVNGDLA